MNEMTNELLEFIRQRVKQKAKEAHEDAGHNGRYDDGGCSTMLKILEMYLQGYLKKVPYEWQIYVDEFTNAKDPEYCKYLELKKKFEGKLG